MPSAFDRIEQTMITKTLAIIAISTGLSTLADAKDHIVEVVTDAENGTTSFKPKFLRIAKGDTVTWVNKMDDFHNVITYPDGFPEGASGFESPYLEQKGESFSFTFEHAGTYQYHCIPHIMMGMRGVVTVGAPTPPNKFHKPTSEEVVAYRDKLLEFFDTEEFGVMPDAVRRNVQP